MIHEVLEHFNINPHIVELLPADREATAELLNARGYVDLLIPRGSSSLINFVRQNATIPVIETGAGICHTFFDRYGDVEKGAAIINNAKTRRVSVCNALDCLLIDGDRLNDLPALCAPLQKSNVIIYADMYAYNALKGSYPAELLKEATEEDFGTEFLDYKMSIKTVQSIREAIAHIQEYGSKHSECIVTEDKTRAEWFCRDVDAACVYVNVPTSFTTERVRSGCRNRYQHTEAACPRSHGSGRTDHVQVDCRRRRTGKEAITSLAPSFPPLTLIHINHKYIT